MSCPFLDQRVFFLLNSGHPLNELCTTCLTSLSVLVCTGSKGALLHPTSAGLKDWQLPAPLTPLTAPFWIEVTCVHGWIQNSSSRSWNHQHCLCSDAGTVSINVHILSQLEQLPLKILLWTPLCFIFPGWNHHCVSVNVKTPLEWTELGQNGEGIISLPTWEWFGTEIIGALWKLSYFHEGALGVQNVIRICIIILIFTCQYWHQWQERALYWKYDLLTFPQHDAAQRQVIVTLCFYLVAQSQRVLYCWMTLCWSLCA